METINKPRRETVARDMATLAKLEAAPRPAKGPDALRLEDVLVMDSLFQPRGDSLDMRPGASARHIEALAKVVSAGRLLDPLAVAAFGPRWVLIDGHHRRAAYVSADYAGEVPVRVFDKEESGKARVAWAVLLSTSLNAKDKLAMSPDDKSDSAWRQVVMFGSEMTKRELVEASTVGERTIGYMRSARKALLASGSSDDALFDMSWSRAKWEAAQLKGETSEPNPDAAAARLRRLMRKLSPAIDNKVPAVLLLEALERLRPGLELELETAIQLSKDNRRGAELLDI